MYIRLEDDVVKKNPQICNTWIYRELGPTWVRPWTMPNLDMVDREFVLVTGSNMGSSDLEFGLETGPVRGLADQELAYYSSLGLDPK